MSTPKETAMTEEQYRITLYESVLLDFLKHCMDTYINNGKKASVGNLSSDITTYASKLRDIEKADFTSNFNPNHREEQPF